MMIIKITSILMVLIGVIFLFLSFLQAMNILGNISGQLRRKWLIILCLIGFFILGYLFFDIILISNLPFPVELVTGVVFLGGAFFVYTVIHISQSTIAAQQKVEEVIALAKDDWENTFDTVTDMITVHDIDFNIVRANPSAKSLLGLRLQKGIPSEKCFRYYHGTEKPPSGCASCQSIQTVKPSTFEVFEPHLNRHLEISAMPQFGKDRQLVGLIHVTRDITDHKQAEEKLKKSESLLQKIFDVLPVGLWFADKDGKLLRGNPAGVKIWGAEPKISPSEYGIFKARRLPSGEEIAPEDWALAHTVSEGVTVVDEMLEIDAFDGKKKVILNYTAPVLDDRGELQGAIVVNLEITQLKEAEKKLQHTLDSLRKAFSTTIQVTISAVETRDPYTAGHQTRSADLAHAIATEMGLSEDKIEAIRMAGPIHDIGKLSIPSRNIVQTDKTF